MAMIKLKGGEYEYSPVDLLGSGAFGSVFKCRRVSNGEVLALKCVEKKKLKAHGSYLVKALQREIKTQRIATESGIPFFVGLYDDFEDKKTIYLVMEFCGKSLNDFLASRRLNEMQCLELVFQVALGLNYLHSIQITHRDIKPDNILIKDGILKIADFGFASNSSQLTTNLGTAPYMSPEFFLDADIEFTPKIDVWALNTCLYRLLTGKFYFWSGSRNQMERLVLQRKFIIGDELKHLSPATKDLLIKAYEKNPDNRLSMSEFVYHDAFKSFRAKYAAFTQKSFHPAHNAPQQKAPQQNDILDPVLIDQMIKMRNNSLYYSELSLLLYDNGFNKLIAFLLLKKNIQNLSGIVISYKKRMKPDFRPINGLSIDNGTWIKMCESSDCEKVLCQIIEDLQVLLVKYSELYKGIVMLSNKDKRLSYLRDQEECDRLFDLNRAFDEKTVKKWFDRFIENEDKFKDIPKSRMVWLMRKVQLYEFHDPEALFK